MKILQNLMILKISNFRVGCYRLHFINITYIYIYYINFILYLFCNPLRPLCHYSKNSTNSTNVIPHINLYVVRMGCVHVSGMFMRAHSRLSVQKYLGTQILVNRIIPNTD